jgi:hypothetical protein
MTPLEPPTIPPPNGPMKRSSAKRLMFLGVIGVTVGTLLTLLPSSSVTRSPIYLPVPTSTDAPVDVTAPVDSPTPADAVLSDADMAKQHDRGWVLETYTATDPGLLEARVKNANSTTMSAVFRMTLLNGARVVAVYRGSADQVESGRTVTVDIATTNPPAGSTLVTGFEFQVDTSY